METRHKILLVDDDPDQVEMYREILTQLPCKPEIQTATSGARAIALLETDPYRMLITDLKMPRMDGLQVLTIVRRKFPKLRTVVLTSVVDEQFRARVYSQGVDLYWQKPGTEREMAMFCDCVGSLLERDDSTGFRGVQSKSLVDIIQIECLSQSSCVLRISNGPLVGRIWINHGELFDADAGELKGEEAFLHILSWKAGNFEILPAEPNRTQVILKSYNALLLETVQAFDELQANSNRGPAEPSATPAPAATDPISQLEGLEFFIVLKPGEAKPAEARTIEDPEGLATWTRATLKRFDTLGEKLQLGEPDTIVGLGMKGHVGLTRQGQIEFCAGWHHTHDAVAVRRLIKQASALWAS
jgi:CheY-like chemotaxis protein